MHMMSKIWILFIGLFMIKTIVAPPVDSKQKEKEKHKNETSPELDDFGLEYGRYLQQVVQALEEDKEFAKKLENVSAEQIKEGHIAKELEFVKHNVRSKLDELKRIEVDRLRKLIQEQMDRTELGVYRDEDGHLLNSPDGRRWRTISNHKRGLEGLNRKGVKIPKHIDVENPHSFEIEDLKKLIKTATKDLEELDRQRREEFKKYELEKEAKYQESLKNMTEEQKKEAIHHHEELIQKHKDHPKIHHPGSKPQLEEVWEEQDHMPKEEFNPRTFFAMHDVNGDGHLDVNEVEAILIPEVKKLYNPNNEEDDPAEMEEEFHRMREHIFNETDKNRDSLISLEEFLKMTEAQEFQQDDGWKGLDEQQVYSEAELQEYMRQRQMEMQHGYDQYPYDQRHYYDVNAPQQGVPPHINYQVPPGGAPAQPGYHGQQQYGIPPQPVYPQQGHPQQFPQQGAPQMQYQAGHPQQQFQGVPPQQQYQAGYPQQQFQGVPQQQFQAGHPQQGQQQFQAGHPQQGQQQFQGGHPQQGQQQFQAGHPQQGQQQFQAGHPQQGQQQFQAGHPQQGQQQFQGVPQQQFQGGAQQLQHPSGNPNELHAGKIAQAQQVKQQNQVPDKQDKSNSINQIPNMEAKPHVPQDSAPHASTQVPKL